MLRRPSSTGRLNDYKLAEVQIQKREMAGSSLAHRAASAVRIRRPTVDDIDQLITIENRCFRAHRFTRVDFEYHLRNPESIFAVAQDANRIVGYIAGIIYRGSKERIGKIYSMAVLPEWRKHHIGSTLLRFFEREAAKRGGGSVTLEVRRSNRAARSLYRQFGYNVDNVLKDYYAPGSHGLKMRKDLNSGNG